MIDNNFFQKANNMIFTLMIVFQVIESLTFHAFYDVPSLILIIASLAMFFHKTYLFKFYQKFTIFLSKYIFIASSLKMLYEVLIQVKPALALYEKYFDSQLLDDGLTVFGFSELPWKRNMYDISILNLLKTIMYFSP